LQWPGLDNGDPKCRAPLALTSPSALPPQATPSTVQARTDYLASMTTIDPLDFDHIA